MKIPFLSLDEPVFKPHKQWGLDPDITADEREMFETIDVLQQQGDWNRDRALEHRLWLAIITLAFILIDGSQILGLIKTWFTK